MKRESESDSKKSWGRRHSVLGIIIFCLSGLILLVIAFIIAGYLIVKNPVSYLPDFQSDFISGAKVYADKFSLKNSWYTLNAYGNGDVSVFTPDGDLLMSGLKYYSHYDDGKESIGLQNIKVRLINDSTFSINGNTSANVLVKMFLIVHKYSQGLDVVVNTVYPSDTKVNRETLLASFYQPVEEVYLKNRKIQTGNFDSEYWLQREGVRFGKGSKSALIYHPKNISSLQLQPAGKLLFINLEYYLDHPLIKIPYNIKSGNDFLDFSAARYHKGSERNDSFTIYFGMITDVVPRIMLVPYGNLAGYVFTEHADRGNIRTHRAAYFGSETISDPKNATGGFVAHKIPVTKSVFYADSTKGESGSSIRDDPDFPQFLDFLDMLYSTGYYDICLHSPEDYTSDRKTMEEAIKFMSDRYSTETWIDHGVLPGKINREAFFCEGLDESSDLYAADLWEQNGTRFFWSPAVEALEKEISPSEEIRHLRITNVSVELWKRYIYLTKYQKNKISSSLRKILKGYFPINELNSFQPLKGNAYPTPLYWQNVTRTKNFYSWTTEFVYLGIPPENSQDQLNNERNQIYKLVDDQGIFLNHGYYVRFGDNNYVLIKKDGEIVINPIFDSILGLLEELKNRGDLYVTTVKDLINYWINCDNVSITYGSDGNIAIINNNMKPVKGFSLILHAGTENIVLCDKTFCFRQAEEDTIIWFDLDTKERVNLSIKNDKL